MTWTWHSWNPVKVSYGRGSLARLPEFVGGRKAALVIPPQFTDMGVTGKIADMLGPQNKSIADMTLGAALFIGVAQALALIPDTSRSGVTITAGHFLV